MHIPLCQTYFDESEFQLVQDALQSGWVTHGPYNTQFEAQFCQLLGVPHAISLNSCTAALFLALLAHDIRGEVILPAFTFVASANAVVTAGATPVLADIDPRTGTLAVDAIKAKITPRTEALMVVHFAGQTAAMDALASLAETHRLLLIEDSAETLNATFNGKQAGSFGVGCFSFFPTKNITTGEGGMLTTHDDHLAARVRALMAHGIPRITHERQQDTRPWFRDALYAGYNFRLSNILAALGTAQMKKLAEITQKRQQHAHQLSALLQPLAQDGFLTLPYTQPQATHAFQMYTLQLTHAKGRDELVTYLKQQGIEASVHFQPPVHQHRYYQDYYRAKPAYYTSDLDQTENLSACILTLPMYPGLNSAQLTYMADALHAYFKRTPIV